MKVALVWFRQDLRLNDNQALIAAIKADYLPVCLFIESEKDSSPSPGEASRWWLYQSLRKLSIDLANYNLHLLLDKGPYLETLERWGQTLQAQAIFWNRRYEPNATSQDTTIQNHFQKKGLRVHTFNANLLFEPWEIKTNNQTPYQVFTPFWKSCLEAGLNDSVIPFPKNYRAPNVKLETGGLNLDTLRLSPGDWYQGIASHWQPGESAGLLALNKFADQPISNYKKDRENPALDGTSSLSPYLHFGEISPRQILNTLKSSKDNSTFIKELGWREFAYHLLYHFPNTITEPLRPKFKNFPWLHDDALLLRWKKGQTGYPLVDAGMRQLWQIGWMHNRVRMVCASFLVKDLLFSWREGASWFLDTLVDADLANNTLGWQWASGCGADAAPYFRIFNPVLQSQKFDPDGVYIRRYVPELRDLPLPWLHKPWLSPPAVLKRSGLVLGKTYPFPIVDHAIARQRALQALSTIVQ